MARPVVTTYRLQFHGGFRLNDARPLLSWLASLGVTHVYASPLCAARRGSTHGYDVTDPTRLNPEIGTEADLAAFHRELESLDMGLVVDIVPNHMAATLENPWWRSVLELGRDSPYATWFDIDWTPRRRGAPVRMRLPVLGSDPGREIESGTLRVDLDDQGLHLRHGEARLPLPPAAWRRILAHALESYGGRLPAHGPGAALRRFIRRIDRLPRGDTPDGRPKRQAAWNGLREDVTAAIRGDPLVRARLERAVRTFRSTGDRAALERFARLLEDLPYRLLDWRKAGAEINYRRFFNITDLAALRIEDPAVFAARHAWTASLLERNMADGLRVDHVDGLRDPAGYLRRLRRLAGRNRWLIVEKILAPGEEPPEDWPVDGTTGYDFLDLVNRLFIDPDGFDRVRQAWEARTGDRRPFEEVARAAKLKVMERDFPGEMDAQAHALARLASGRTRARGLSPADCAAVLREVTAGLDVYRTYAGTRGSSDADRRAVRRAVRSARRHAPDLDPRALAFLARVLRLAEPLDADPARRRARIDFVLRWQQFTGAIMAKGAEDTAHYIRTPLASLNEVGSDPDAGALSPESFHAAMRRRALRGPRTMNASTTHDTKRGEDVRARLDVLSEIPDRWSAALTRWIRWNRAARKKASGRLLPDTADEILVYQTMLGAWPLRDALVPEFRRRLEAYMLKAARESRRHTRWTNPDPAYEQALRGFIDRILKAGPGNRFLPDFLAFRAHVAKGGALNGLAQLVIRATAPGVCDLYRGAELWELSLVDPDNRRPLDFGKRIRMLAALPVRAPEPSPERLRELLDHWPDGRIKMFVAARALAFRRSAADLFLEGGYRGLAVHGSRSGHVVAFERRFRRDLAITVVPRLMTRRLLDAGWPTGRGAWNDAALTLADGAPREWTNVLTGETIAAASVRGKRRLRIADALATLPVAVLRPVPFE